jgi:hypothetical protein
MRSGFAMIEILITLMVVAAMIPITVLCIKPFENLLGFNEEIQDQIALSQLRRILLLSYEIKCDPEQITFVYQEKLRNLSCINDHLILSPGTQIFISNIDTAYFIEEGNCIYIVYERQQKQYEKILCQTN